MAQSLYLIVSLREVLRNIYENYFLLNERKKMKYFLIIPIFAAMILSGCTKENSVVGPQQPQTTKNEWISINHSTSLSKENTYTASKSIDGSRGGTISLAQSFKSNGTWSIVTATLTIPKGAFTGTQVISYTVNTDCAGINFFPSPSTFAKNLNLDLVFTGIDISGYDPNHLGFAYLDGTSIIPARFIYTNANIANGLLVVLGAQISHFSRYGWATIDGPLPEAITDGGQE